jgi:hypothetical protein
VRSSPCPKANVHSPPSEESLAVARRPEVSPRVPHFVSTVITCIGVPDVLADMGLRLGPGDIAGLELAERFTDRRILSFAKIGIGSPHLGGA